MKVFKLRSQIISEIRSFFGNQDYLEVETPMMHSVLGGAAAKPFTTHHNALDMDLYLRIAPELYLKRLVVGGLEKVFEINRNFRNEGLSTKHNPEFTMLEYYTAYANFEDQMEFIESLFKFVAGSVLGSTVIGTGAHKCDLGKPFKRITLISSVAEKLSVKEEDLRKRDVLESLAEKLHIEGYENLSDGKLLFELFEEVVEESLDQPTFITGYPI